MRRQQNAKYSASYNRLCRAWNDVRGQRWTAAYLSSLQYRWREIAALEWRSELGQSRSLLQSQESRKRYSGHSGSDAHGAGAYGNDAARCSVRGQRSRCRQGVLAQLKAREAASETSKPPGAATIFDYGYFLSSLKQIEWMYKEDLTGGIDGYQFVQKALAIEPDSSEMHFAAAIMASSQPRHSGREEHLRKARAAKNDSLLAQNLSTHFQ